MKRRGHRIVRYADDVLILKKSKSAAANALLQATSLFENDLKLTVNHSREGVTYLGVLIRTQFTAIQPKRLARFKEKVKAHAPEFACKSGASHQALEPPTARFCELLSRGQLQVGVARLDGVVTTPTPLKTAEALEEARKTPPPLAAVGLQGSISGGKYVAVATGGKPTGKLRPAQLGAGETGTV